MKCAPVDPDGLRLPIKIDATSSDEFAPVPVGSINRLANRLALDAAGQNARRLGMSRRSFQKSLMGVASTLLCFNDTNVAHGRTGGRFQVSQESGVDAGAAEAELDKAEFIFDVHGHFINPTGAWLDSVPADQRPMADLPKSYCELADAEGDRSYLHCLSADQFIRDVFLESDTDMMVLTFVPSAANAEPLTIEEADAARALVDELHGAARLLIHGRVNPNQAGDIEQMPELASRWDACAWKCYTHWAPDGGRGFWLTDDVGLRMIEEARRLGVPRICVHKGIVPSLAPMPFSGCDDIGAVARMYPDVDFLVYHSGFHIPQTEGPFLPGAGTPGIDTLVQSLIDHEVPPNSNVYADLGTTWRFLMRDVDQAAHTLGKLLCYVGEDNVLWGTDSIWYGSPQDQIQAFRTFEISAEFQDAYGYPSITPGIRAKVFGLNAAKVYGVDAGVARHRTVRDSVGLRREAHQEEADPHFLTYGPKDRRQFLRLVSAAGHKHG